MSGPVALRWVFAVVLAAVALYCVGGVVSRRAGVGGCGARRGVEFGHAVMAAGMAVMLCPSAPVLGPIGWELFFGAVAAWFLALRPAAPTAGAAGRLHDTGAALAMVFTVAAAPGGHAGMAASGDMPTHASGMLPSGATLVGPVVAWVLASYFVLHAAASVARAAGGERRAVAATVVADGGTLAVARLAVAGPRGGLAWTLLGCCRAAMSAGMGFMLLTLL